MVGETIKDLAGKDAGEESEGVAQLLDPGRFEVGEDEVARSQLHGVDVFLVGRPRRHTCSRPRSFDARALGVVSAAVVAS